MLIATVDQVGPNSFNVVDYNLYDWLMEFWSQIYKDTGDSGLCWHLPKKTKNLCGAHLWVRNPSHHSCLISLQTLHILIKHKIEFFKFHKSKGENFKCEKNRILMYKN